MIPPKADAAHVISAADALERLRAGNRSYRSNVQGISTFIDSARRSELVSVQEPFAIVLGCADSRVPAEIICLRVVGAEYSLEMGTVDFYEDLAEEKA